MKKTSLSFVFLSLFLASCSHSNNSVTSQIPSVGDLESTLSVSGPSTMTSPSDKTSMPDSADNSISAKSEVEQIYELISQCIEKSNYTIEFSDMDGTLVRKYTENAYFCLSPFDVDTIGYMQDSEGIFSFVYQDDKIVPTSSYLVDSENNKITDLYTATQYDQYEQMDLNIIYSFALLDLTDFANLDSQETSNGFRVENDAVINLIPYLQQQQFMNADVKVSLSNGSLEFKFNVSNGFSTSVISVFVKEIGTTTIDLVDEYLASGQGALPPQVDNPQLETTIDKVKKVFEDQNYMYMINDNISVLVTENYVCVGVYDEISETTNSFGYVNVPQNNSGYEEGIHFFTLTETSVEVYSELDMEHFRLTDTYAFDPEMLNLFEETPEGILSTSLDDSMMVSGYSHYFDPSMEKFVGEIFMMAMLDGTTSDMILISAIVYNYNYNDGSFTPTDDFISITISQIGGVNSTFVPQLSYIEDFLATLN